MPSVRCVSACGQSVLSDRLLEPESFVTPSIFLQQLEANRPVVRALASIRSSPPNLQQARNEIIQLHNNPSSASLTQGPFFASILDRLAAEEVPSRDILVGLQHDVSALGLTSQIISRTRKAEVLPERPLRKAQSYRVNLTPPERQFYQNVATLCRLINPSTDGWGTAMSALMAYRYTASCIPASIEYFRERLGASIEPLLLDRAEQTEDESGWLTTSRGGTKQNAFADSNALSAGIQNLLSHCTENLITDSKFDELWRVLQHIWHASNTSESHSRKIIIFSYFKRTLNYLARRFQALSIGYRLIHGDISIPEREVRIDEFLNHENILILLSSEVGSEGLDLQAASVVVNYDLPWNPMVVEQRIGRVDRIGQESPVITIVNLVIRDTVEDTMLLRLYERINLFTETIGELAPILGDRVEKLVLEALRGELTAAEQIERADEQADVFLCQQSQAKNLQDQADKLLASDQAFLDEIENLLGERRIPHPSELYRFVHSFVRNRYPGSSLPDRAIQGLADIVLQPQIAIDLENWFRGETEGRVFASRIRHGPFMATFDPDVYLKHPRAELFSTKHPLVRLVCEAMGRDSDHLHRTFALLAPVDGLVAPEPYLFSIWLFDIKGFRQKTELKPIFWSLSEQRLLDDESSHKLLVALLDQGMNPNGPVQFDPKNVQTARQGLIAHVDNLRATLSMTEREWSTARLQRRRATMEGILRSRVEAAERRLSTLRESNAKDFPVQMAQAKLKRQHNQLNDFLGTESVSTSFSMEDSEIALGIVWVIPDQGSTSSHRKHSR